MGEPYQMNQPGLPGGSYGFPQYYTANQLNNLSYQSQAIVGAQNEMMMQAFAMPHTAMMAQGQAPRGTLEPPSASARSKALSSDAAKKKKAKKKTAKKKPKKKIVKKKKKPKKKPKKKKVAKKKKVPKKKPKKKKVPKKKELKPKPKITKSGKKKKEKDPDAPKRARTAFNFFLDDFRVQFKEENPDTKGIVEVTKAGSEAWKTLEPEKKKRYEEMAETSQRVYLEAKQRYLDNGGPTMFKYVSGPHRPPTAYFIFLGNFRKQYLAENPGVKGVSAISKGAGIKWRSLSPEEREEYEKKGKAVKEEYYKIKAMTIEERKAYVAVAKDPYARFF